MSETDEQKAVSAKVEEYNDRIDALIAERTAFMDENMHLFSKFKVGDEIYYRGALVGHVTRLYRLHAGTDERFDTTMDVDCEYREIGSSMCIGNTSCKYGAWAFSTKAEAAQEAKRKYEALSR